MPTLRTIRRRITAVQNTAKITQAMRMISAAQLKRAQNNIESARPYVLKLADILGNVVDAVGEGYSHPLIEKREEIKGITLITIASDRGLCGSFNNNLFRFVTNYIDTELFKEHHGVHINHITVGKRTGQFFRKQNVDLIKDYSGIFSNLNFTVAKDIVNVAKNEYFKGKTDKVIIAFNEFKNVIIQRPKLIQLLPIVSTVSNTNGKLEKEKFNLDYIFEPEQKAILDDLLPKYVDIQLWRTLLESFAAEQAARMMAMENATKNA
ncbi:ATP synthase F1 subunit gamma, partial [Bacteroidetes/Chlorobi group bacterium ChocPot_Mid]